MSHIPNSAMPHAHAPVVEEGRRDRLRRRVTAMRGWANQRALSVRERARDNPRVTVAAAATTALALLAAAAFPMVRRRVAA